MHYISKDDERDERRRLKRTYLFMVGIIFEASALLSVRGSQNQKAGCRDQPTFQATADRSTNQEEAREPSGCQSASRLRTVARLRCESLCSENSVDIRPRVLSSPLAHNTLRRSLIRDLVPLAMYAILCCCRARRLEAVRT